MSLFRLHVIKLKCASYATLLFPKIRYFMEDVTARNIESVKLTSDDEVRRASEAALGRDSDIGDPINWKEAYFALNTG
mgnify:CR=1 FL=1